jgi:hypothetical protein
MGAARLGADDAAALANVRASLPDLDGWPEPLDGLAFAGTAPGTATDEPAIAALRRATFEAWGAAMADIPVDGERLDRLTVAARLGREPDAAARRRLFLAMAPGWTVLDGEKGAADPNGPYRRLLRASALRWKRHGSPIAKNAAALGMDPEAVEPTMREILAAYRRVAMPPRLVEPWDYRYVTGGLARRLDPDITLPRLRPINDGHLSEIGADPGALRIEYDIVPRPDRPVIPTAFTVTLDIARRTADDWRPARPWVFATYAEGGLGNLEELLHESGHAVHYAALRARPASLLARRPDRVRRGRGRHRRLDRPRACVPGPASRGDRLSGGIGGLALLGGDARRLLGALRDRAPPTPGSCPERGLGRDRRA